MSHILYKTKEMSNNFYKQSKRMKMYREKLNLPESLSELE